MIDRSISTLKWLLFLGLLTACGQTAVSPDEQLRDIINTHRLTGDPSQGRELPSISDPLAQLGMQLFYTQALSGAGDAACVSCHHPLLGGDDGLPLSIGVGADDPALLGPGRTHPEGALVARNAPTTFNCGLWDEVMFWDGRVESLGKTPLKNGGDGQGIHTPDRVFHYADPEAGANLVEAQSRFPVTADVEMRGFDFGMSGQNGSDIRNALAANIGDYGDGAGTIPSNDWLPFFQSAFNSDANAEELITYASIAHAIGEYERSQLFVETAWKAYVQGDDEAISASAKRGAILFYGRAGCAACHAGDFFTDEQFYVTAVPQIGYGTVPYDDDWGRYSETGDEADRYAFRVPTLLNVEVTEPYGHDGAYQTLEGIVRHMVNPETAVAVYAFNQFDSSIHMVNSKQHTEEALAQLHENRSKNIKTLVSMTLTDEEIDDIVEFLLTLTDPCVKEPACLAPWIPSESLPDPDGLRLDAVFQN